MAEEKKLGKIGLSQVWSKIVANFVAKETGKGLSEENFTAALKTKLDRIADNAQVNAIESVTVNGVELEITNKGISISIPEGALSALDEVGIDNLTTALKTLINEKANTATSLSGYGILDAYTKTETNNAIKNAVDTAIAGIYKFKGSTTFASLPASASGGDVYNITDEFTTTEAFIEGEGKAYPAGTNVAYTENGWDCLAGIYDFSEFLKASDLEDITEEEINEICVIP